jgi:hypothetical protein
MKTLLIKALGKWADQDSVGKVHLDGAMDLTACGLDYADYDSKSTNKPINCTTCLTYLNWAKKVSKIKI